MTQYESRIAFREVVADDLALDCDDDRSIVLIAGGVGIAPFRAILREVAMIHAQLPATLFYSNRRPEDAAYLDELCGMEVLVPSLRVIPIMTRMDESRTQWSGESERPALLHLRIDAAHFWNVPGARACRRRRRRHPDRDVRRLLTMGLAS